MDEKIPLYTLAEKPEIGAGKLATYKGYIVDCRLRQFRSQPEDYGKIEFIDFSSEQGEEFLIEMIQLGFDSYERYLIYM